MIAVAIALVAASAGSAKAANTTAAAGIPASGVKTPASLAVEINLGDVDLKTATAEELIAASTKGKEMLSSATLGDVPKSFVSKVMFAQNGVVIANVVLIGGGGSAISVGTIGHLTKGAVAYKGYDNSYKVNCATRPDLCTDGIPDKRRRAANGPITVTFVLSGFTSVPGDLDAPFAALNAGIKAGTISLDITIAGKPFVGKVTAATKVAGFDPLFAGAATVSAKMATALAALTVAAAAW